MIKRFLILSVLFFVVSCNFRIEKRRYFKGYYVEAQKSNSANSKKPCYNTSNYELTSYEGITTEPIQQNETSVSFADINLQSKKTIALKLISNPDNSENVQTKNSSLNISKTNQIHKRKIHKKNSSSINKKQKTKGDGYLYGLAALLGLLMLGGFQKIKFISIKISNWAAKNKHKALLFIASIQVVYSILGAAIGKKLHDLGYEFSNQSIYVLAGLSILGIVLLVHQKISNTNNYLKSFFRKKMAHMAIALSTLMTMVVIGNKIGQSNPTNSAAGYVIEHLHTIVFKKDKSKIATIQAYSRTEEKHATGDNAGLIALYIFLTVVLAIVLVVLCCAVWCWATMSTPYNPLFYVIAAAVTLLSIGLLVLAITGITRLAKEDKKNPSTDLPTY